jgi:hypothetical protein
MTGKTNVPMRNKFSLITWGGGTEDEITDMFTAHYKGTINISNYWKVGDTRSVTISAIASGTTGESQSSQSVDLIIIGFNHDTLASTNGTRTKAAITVQTKNCLTTIGYMNADDKGPSYAVYTDSKRRSWCNSEFKSALPSWLQNLIKPVTKYTNRFCSSYYSNYSSYRTHTSSTESCYLLSEWEVFGCQNLDISPWGSLDADGTQYEYMKTTGNRIKYLGTDTSANNWWTRTSYVNRYGDALFLACNTYSLYDTLAYANYTRGVAPGFSL